jgi:hypothetical protein
MYPFVTLQGAFQLGGQQLKDDEVRWCLAAAGPLPNTTILSLYNADELVAHFREIHPPRIRISYRIAI